MTAAYDPDILRTIFGPKSMGVVPDDRSKRGGWSGCSAATLVLAVLIGAAVGATVSWYLTKGSFDIDSSSFQPSAPSAPSAPSSPASNVVPDCNPSPPGNPASTQTEPESPMKPPPNEIVPVAETGPSAEELRLPTAVVPKKYTLSVKTYLPGYVPIPEEKKFTFDAQVEVVMEVRESVRKIVFNAKHLNVTLAKVSANGKNIGAKPLEQPEFEKFSLTLDEAVNKGDHLVVKIKYTGLINSDLGGLYQSKYTETDGTEKVFAVTQMEPTDARQLVPCLDEPEYKANWTVTVIHPKGTSAISNGIELESKSVDDDTFISSRFKDTPRMSSYLLAIIVSELTYQEKKTSTGIRFRVWSRPEAKETTQFALDAGVACLEYYEKYYNVSFPLEKQDMVALPDFSAGAMENWGLITYRETDLLYDSKIYTADQKKRVAVVIAHELAHQWFGNLVTMKWWDDLWLNEGFATLVEYLGTDTISQGHMKMKDMFLIDAQDGAFDIDSSATKHPLSFRIDKSVDVSEAFDGITYDKGGSVLNMIRAVMGEINFNKGLNTYLLKHQYNNAKAIDLWEALDTAVPDSGVNGPDGKKLNVTLFALQWTTQMGFPYLSVSQVNDTTVKITQTRYKINPLAVEKEKYASPEYKFKWDVPVWYKVGDSDAKMTWLSRDADLYLPIGKAEALVLNDGSYAFHRTSYDQEHLKMIIHNLNTNHAMYSNRTRFRILSDAFAMAKIGKIEYKDLFDMIDYIKNDWDYLPWTAMSDGFGALLGYFGTDPDAKIGFDYYKGLLKSQYDNTTTEIIQNNYQDEARMYENLQQVRTFKTYCSLRSSSCDANIKEMFQSEVVAKCKPGEKTSDCVGIAPPLRAKVYCHGVSSGDDGVFEKMLNFYKKESVQVEKGSLLNALGCSRDPMTLKSLLKLAMDRKAGVIRFQDVSTTFGIVARSLVGREFIFNFLLQHWQELYDRFNADYSTMSRVIKYSTANIQTKAELEQLDIFYKTAPGASKYNSVLESKETAQANIAWTDKHLAEITDIMKNRLG